MKPDTGLADILKEGPIVLYDGVCNFCNSSVQFVIKRDPGRRFRFASLQSETGLALLRHFQLADKNIDSIVLIQQGQAFVRSAAGLQIARQLSSMWPALYSLIWIPAPLRDGIYNWIARNRYRWFGRSESCQIPDPATRARFLDV